MTNANTPRAMIGNIPVYCAYDEIIPTAKATPNPLNPNQHPERQINLLAEIIKQQGWRAPITISTRSGYIVRGHGRLLAARLLGAQSVPVDFQNYDSDAAEKADMVADNRIAEFSDLDEDILAELLDEINGSDLDIELSGFDFSEIEHLLPDVEEEPSFDSGAPYAPSEPSSYQAAPSETSSADYIQPTYTPSDAAYADDFQRNHNQTGEINLGEYAEERYAHECPKCKFRW